MIGRPYRHVFSFLSALRLFWKPDLYYQSQELKGNFGKVKGKQMVLGSETCASDQMNKQP